MSKPKIFIGSSSESIYLASALFSNIDNNGRVEATPWFNGVFEGGNYTMEDLSNQLDLNDFGVFILDLDDIVYTRGNLEAIARDNVIFELGLFMGRLGRDRVFFVTPKELPEDIKSLEILIPLESEQPVETKTTITKDGKVYEKKAVNTFKTPSDLFGISPLQYRLRSDGNWKAAMTDVSSQIIDKCLKLGKKESSQDKIDDLTEQLENLVSAYDHIEKQYRFINQAKIMPVLLEEKDYNLLLMALDDGLNVDPFKLKGITIFKLEDNSLVQCGQFKNVGKIGMPFKIKYDPSNCGEINVIEAHKSCEIRILKKKNGNEYLISIPLLNHFVITIHLYDTMFIDNKLELLNELINDDDPVFQNLEKILKYQLELKGGN